MQPIDLALVCDYLEEGWLSMDLVADMLFDHLSANHAGRFQTQRLRPTMNRRFSLFPKVGGSPALWNTDRLLNRHLDYPKWLAKASTRFGVFHIVDHSYAHLVNHLPARRTVVSCHDIDAFRSVLDPLSDPRPFWFRHMTRRILEGFCAAAEIICGSAAVRSELVQHQIIPPDRLTVIPLGIHPSCSPEADPEADAAVNRWLDQESVYLLHVGSTIPRKRIDVLLDVMAAVVGKGRNIKLLRVGGAFTESQERHLKGSALDGRVQVLPFLDRRLLSAVYRRAALVLQPSESEGFGLPVLEALACGCPVVASDLPVLREIGGSAITFCRVADTSVWAETVLAMLEQRRTDPAMWSQRMQVGLSHAAQFTWTETARRTAEVYERILRNQ